MHSFTLNFESTFDANLTEGIILKITQVQLSRSQHNEKEWGLF